MMRHRASAGKTAMAQRARMMALALWGGRCGSAANLGDCRHDTLPSFSTLRIRAGAGFSRKTGSIVRRQPLERIVIRKRLRRAKKKTSASPTSGRQEQRGDTL